MRLYILLFFFFKTMFTASQVNDDIKQHSNYAKLPLDSCGESLSDRIVGGRKASIGDYPWMARIGFTVDRCEDSNVLFKCGGSLITETIVLSAAHCMVNLASDRCKKSGQYNQIIPYLVRLGEHDEDTDIDCEEEFCADPAQDISIAKIHVHHKYNEPKFANDIAIIKLEKAANFSLWVSPICLLLAQENHPSEYINKTAFVAGWGITDVRTGQSSSALLVLRLPIVDVEQCAEFFKATANVSEDIQLCAGGKQGEDSCSGDSGGPLFIIADPEEKGPKFYILGVVSFGYNLCGEKPAPGVYTNLLSYSDWIMDHI